MDTQQKVPCSAIYLNGKKAEYFKDIYDNELPTTQFMLTWVIRDS